MLDQLLDAQAYRLSFWRVASDEINYRRFFDINELAALSMERPEVFDATHELIFRFLREGKIDGLRIDHPDGLYDPKQYLQRLQRRYALELAHNAYDSRSDLHTPSVGRSAREKLREQLEKVGSDSPLWRPLYVVVEKILGTGEPLPTDWPVYGTSGYEFVNAVNDLFVDPENAQKFTRPLLRLGRGRSDLRRDGPSEKDADAASRAVERIADAGLSTRPIWRKRIAGRATSRFTACAMRCARSWRLSPFTALTYPKKAFRIATAVTSSRPSTGPSAQPRHHRVAVSLCARHAVAALSGNRD